MAAAAAPPHTSTVGSKSSHRHFFRVRLAAASDVPHIHKLIHQMAVFENLDTHLFPVTETDLSGSLFTSPPFVSVTVLILEASPNPFPETSPHSRSPNFTPIVRFVDSETPLEDPESEIFESEGEIDVTVGGHALFYPNFAPYFGKQGMFLEHLFVRECYRRNGLGRMLMAAVAEQAVKMDCCSVNWLANDWNVNAIRFYEGIGARVVPGLTSCRLDGDALHAFANANGESKFDFFKK